MGIIVDVLFRTTILIYFSVTCHYGGEPWSKCRLVVRSMLLGMLFRCRGCDGAHGRGLIAYAASDANVEKVFLVWGFHYFL